MTRSTLVSTYITFVTVVDRLYLLVIHIIYRSYKLLIHSDSFLFMKSPVFPLYHVIYGRGETLVWSLVQWYAADERREAVLLRLTCLSECFHDVAILLFI